MPLYFFFKKKWAVPPQPGQQWTEARVGKWWGGTVEGSYESMSAWITSNTWGPPGPHVRFQWLSTTNICIGTILRSSIGCSIAIYLPPPPTSIYKPSCKCPYPCHLWFYIFNYIFPNLIFFIWLLYFTSLSPAIFTLLIRSNI